MKTIVVLILCIQLLCFSVLITQTGSIPPVEFNKISDRMYEVTGGIGSRCGVYIGDNGVLLIDTKWGKSSMLQLLEGLKRITDKPIIYLINTHSDIDHTSGNIYLPETVTIVAHENCVKEMLHPQMNGKPSLWNSPGYKPFLPSKTFKEKMDIQFDEKKIELWYFGIGHTCSDIVVYFPEEKIAFIGDQAFTSKQQVIRSHLGGSSFEHVNTLRKMLERIDAEKFYSGHVDMTNRDGIKYHIFKMERMQDNIASYVSQGKTLVDIIANYKRSDSKLVETIYSEITRN